MGSFTLSSCYGKPFSSVVLNISCVLFFHSLQRLKFSAPSTEMSSLVATR